MAAQRLIRAPAWSSNSGPVGTMPKLDLLFSAPGKIRQLLAAGIRKTASASQSAYDRFAPTDRRVISRSDAVDLVEGRPTAISGRYAAVALVVALHVLMLWLFAASLRNLGSEDTVPEAHLTLVALSRAASQSMHALAGPQFITPKAVLAPEPDIKIEQAANPSNAITAIDLSHKLAPRPDPSHINLPAGLPDGSKAVGPSASAFLRILVQPDGSISDAEVAQSTGSRLLDALAIAWVKQNWRFIAASAGGRPIPDWTTVSVPFKTA